MLPKSKTSNLTIYLSVIVFIIALMLEQWVSYPRDGVVAGLMMVLLLCGSIALSNLFFLIPLKSKTVQFSLVILFVLLIVLSILIIKTANSINIPISGFILVMIGWGIVIYLLRVGYRSFKDK